MAIVASLGLADRVNATYFFSDGARAPAGDYLNRGWYYLLDDGQYYYLDRGQYNLLGELGYLLGHPCYPKLFERDLDQAVGFTNRPHIGWFSLYGGQVPISEYAVWSYHFNAGDYIDRGRYYYLDIARRGMVLQSLMRLKQICNHPSQLTGDGDYIASDSGKFLKLGEICDEIQ